MAAAAARRWARVSSALRGARTGQLKRRRLVLLLEVEKNLATVELKSDGQKKIE